MPDDKKHPSAQVAAGQKVGAQQQKPVEITELRTIATSLFDGGVLTTPYTELRGTAEPGVEVRIIDTAANLPSSAQTGEDGIWISPRLSLERGEHVFTAIVQTPDGENQSPPFSINVVIGERFRIIGFYLYVITGTLPCGATIPISSSSPFPLILVVRGQKGTRIQMANSGQSPDTPAPDSPLWDQEVTILQSETGFQISPLGLLPISNWFHVRTVDEGPPHEAKCLANFVRKEE